MRVKTEVVSCPQLYNVRIRRDHHTVRGINPVRIIFHDDISFLVESTTKKDSCGFGYRYSFKKHYYEAIPVPAQTVNITTTTTYEDTSMEVDSNADPAPTIPPCSVGRVPCEVALKNYANFIDALASTFINTAQQAQNRCAEIRKAFHNG